MIQLPQKLQPYQRLIKNFTSLSVLQIANYIFPLVVLPYLVRVLGPSKYGLINFAAAFIGYFSLICDYGFNLSGTKTISVNRTDKEKLSNIFSSIIIIKILLLVIAFSIFLLLIFIIPFFSNDQNLYLIYFGIVIGNLLFPLWFYQGIEQMKYITFIQVSFKSLLLILIFILIKKENDYLLLAALYSSAQIAAGLAGQFIAYLKFGIRFKIPSKEFLFEQLSAGWHMFLSMISINIYTTSNTFVLGLFASNSVVGYFAAADKIRIAFQGVQSVISQTVFPYTNKLFKESKIKFISFIKKLLIIESSIGIIVSVILFVFADLTTSILLGNKFAETAQLLRIISVLPLLISISNVFGIQTMISAGFEKNFNVVIGFAAVVHLIILFTLIPVYFAVGTTTALVITELIVTVLTFSFVKRNKILEL